MAGSRRLAAIMFADISGYTRMMEADESIGRQKAQRFRTVLNDMVSKFDGQVIQYYGDGSLCVFTSAVQATSCGWAIQRELQNGPVVPVRIGIHLGDIAFEGKDIFGAGVNLASRVESMGVPGSVLVSENVQYELRNHDEFRLTPLGKFSFKNVPRKVAVFALDNEGLVVPNRKELSGKLESRPNAINYAMYLAIIILVVIFGSTLFNNTGADGPLVHSLAVMPLNAHTDSDDGALLQNGVHDGLISALGELDAVKVISKPSTMAFAATEKTTSEVARALNVDCLLLGELTQKDDSVFINLSLMRVQPTSGELWSNTYYGTIGDVFKIYQSVTVDIANKIHAELTTPTGYHAGHSVNPETYKAYLRGMYFINKSTPEEMQKGINFLQDAVAIDPADPWVYAGLAQGYAWLGHGPDPEEQVWKLGRAAAIQSLKLDSTIAEAHTVLSIIDFYYNWDYSAAEKGFQRALRINPNMALAHFQYAWFLAVMGRFDEAIQHHLMAKELDPLLPIYTVDMGSLYLWAGQTEKALVEVEEGLRLDPQFGHGWWVYGNVQLALGNNSEAIEAHIKASQINPIWKGALAGTYALTGDTVKAEQILTSLENDEISPRTAFWIAYIYMTLGDYDNMYKWFNYRPADPWLVSVRTWPEFKTVRNDPRFIDFLKSIGFSEEDAQL